MNKAQAYKWAGDDAKAKQIIAAEDWSSSADMFGLAIAVIHNDFDKAAKIMKRIGPEGDPTESSYLNSTLFREFRKTSQFKAAYHHVFKKSSVTVEEELGTPLSRFNVLTTALPNQSAELVKEDEQNTDISDDGECGGKPVVH